MVSRTLTLVILVFALLVPATSPLSPTVYGESCASEIDRQARNLQRLKNRIDKDAQDLIKTEVQEAALSKMKKIALEDNPTLEAAEEWRANYEEWSKFVGDVNYYRKVTAELRQCLRAGAGNCVSQTLERGQQLLEESSKALKDWIDSLADDSLSKAKERVERLDNVLSSYVEDVGSNAASSAQGALDNCLRNIEQRAQASQQQRPVDLRTQPAQGPAQPQPPASSGGAAGGGSPGATAAASGGGMGTGMIAGVTLAAVGAGAGLYALNEYSKQVQCNQYEGEAYSRMNSVTNAVNALLACGTSQSCYASRENAVNSALSSLNTTLGNWCTCLGASAQLSAEDRAAVRDAFSSLRAAGVNPGTLPACFR